MPRRALPPKIRAIVMQALLVGVFGATVGLAALVTRHVRSSMRVEMGDPKNLGRIAVRLPAKWLSSPAPVEKGDGIEAEEPPGEQVGRRLRVQRQRTSGLIPPLEHLARTGLVKADALKALAEGREGYSIKNLPIGGWPGQVVTTTVSPRPGVVHKDVIACATLPGSEAIVIGLEGLGPPDASDLELVRQVSETVTLTARPAASIAPPAGPIQLVDEITVDAPPHYLEVKGADEHDFQRQLIYDGSSGWVGIDLASCVFFADDREEALLAMLAARDAEWRSGPVKRLGPRTWMVDRAVSAVSDPGGFPSRAYLSANTDGRAVLVVMRGGPRDGRLFDGAWQALAGSLKFNGGAKDLSSLLANGAEAANRVGGGRLEEILPRDAASADRGAEDWYLWDAWANAGSELWSALTWQARLKDGAWESIGGKRETQAVGPYLPAGRVEQTWQASADLSTYQATTSREVPRGVAAAAGGGGGALRARPRFEQRVSVDHGRMTLAVDVGTSLPDAAVPPQYVPGAVVPLVMRELAERPALIRTESFVGVETVAAGGVLTLFVTRLADAPPRYDESGELMECVTVGVNGTGVVSRWYYQAGDEPGSHVLRFIDFAGGLKAAAGGGK